MSKNFKRVICIGDTPAVRSGLTQYSGRAKMLPTLSSPTPGELVAQMQMLMSTVPDTINSMRCLEPIDEEKATVSEAEVAAEQEVVVRRAKEALGTPTKGTDTEEVATRCPVSRRLF